MQRSRFSVCHHHRSVPSRHASDFYANNRVSAVSVNSTTLLSAAAYEPFGPVRGWTWGNGTSEIRLHNTDGNTSLLTGIESVSLGYDDAFRIASVINSSNGALTWNYGYDSLDRLTSASEAGTSLSWVYDANGNRVQLSGASPTSALSAVGNYTYNDRGRLISASVAGTSASYIYNSTGKMIEKNVGGVVTILMYDEAGHLLGEYSGSGALIQETIWLGDIPVATLRPNGSSVSMNYVHADQLGAPRMVTRSSDNAILWRWDTDPFGTTAPTNPNSQTLGAFIYNLRFPGQYYQAETGLNYNYFRDYDPATGRYIESDPIGLNGGSYATYAYAKNIPLSLMDPSGEDCVNSDRQVVCVTPTGITFVVPATENFPATLGGDNFWYHDYDVSQSIGCADAGAVMQGFINNPTPGVPTAATPNGTPNNAVVPFLPPLPLFDNPVVSYLTVDPNLGIPVVVNLTGPGSLFNPGYVARYVYNGVAHTTGEGANWLQSWMTFSQQWIPDQLVWGVQMSQLISNAKKSSCQCSQ